MIKRLFFGPLALLSTGVVAFGAATGNWLVTGFGVFGWVANAVWTGITGQISAGPHPSELGAEGRSLLRPLTESRRRLAELADRNRHLPEVSVISEEAVQEADAIIQHATKLIQNRQGVKALLRTRNEAQLSLGRLSREMEQTRSDAERASLQSAMAATQRQIEQYSELERKSDQILAQLRDAQAALASLEADLTSRAASQRMNIDERGELDEMMQRLRSLNRSLEEAEQMEQTEQA